MNRKLIFALFVFLLAGLLTACNGETVPPVTIEPTAVIPTEIPSPTPTEVPTAVPTEVPTPTATPEPTVWKIAKTMLGECVGFEEFPNEDFQFSYAQRLFHQVLEVHPEFEDTSVFANTSAPVVLGNDGENPSPFAFVDGDPDEMEWIWGEPAGFCQWYFLIYENVPDNFDEDGILVGEAFLFYEVGGTEPFVLDGELREVQFVFPPAP